MTTVAFHLGAKDVTMYACRLLRKAFRQGARVRVLAAAQDLVRLDAALWTFDPQEFIPHARLGLLGTPGNALAGTPIWLSTPQEPWPTGLQPAEVLVNLTDEVVADPAQYARVIEVVSEEPADKAAARQRWRHYRDTGFDCQHHEA